MSSSSLLILIFLFISCGVKKDPTYLSGERDLFVKSFMNKVGPVQKSQADSKKKKKENKE